MKILVVNFHSGKNAGDLALLLRSIGILKDAFENPEIKVSANWLDEDCYQEHGIEVIPSVRSILETRHPHSALRQILLFVWLYFRMALFATFGRTGKKHGEGDFDKLAWAFAESELIIAVSGNQVYSSGKFGWPLPVTLAPINFARIFKKPLVIFPQSIGPLKRQWERSLVKKAYGTARMVFARDDKSLQLLRELGLNQERYAYAPDPAFGIRESDEQEAWSVLKKYGVSIEKPKMGLTVIAPMGKALDQAKLSRYYLALEEAIANFSAKTGAQVLIFVQVWGPSAIEDDRIPSRGLTARLKARGVDVILIDEVLAPSLLKACYGLMDCFVATRLHSGIFAFSAGVPTLFLGYLTKTEGLTKRLGMEEHFIDINAIDPELLLQKLNELWENRVDLGEKIERINQKTQADLELVTKFLKEKTWR